MVLRILRFGVPHSNQLKTNRSTPSSRWGLAGIFGAPPRAGAVARWVPLAALSRQCSFARSALYEDTGGPKLPPVAPDRVAIVTSQRLRSHPFRPLVRFHQRLACFEQALEAGENVRPQPGDGGKGVLGLSNP
jgi:hypothetical protein